jgi:hypothetical protein
LAVIDASMQLLQNPFERQGDGHRQHGPRQRNPHGRADR